MHKSCLLGVAVCLLALLVSASPQAHAEGFYAGIEGGATFFNDDYTRVVIPPAPTLGAHTNYDVGWLAGANAGYELPLGFALEEEFAFRESEIDRIANSGGAIFKGGDAHSYSIMTMATIGGTIRHP